MKVVVLVFDSSFLGEDGLRFGGERGKWVGW